MDRQAGRPLSVKIGTTILLLQAVGFAGIALLFMMRFASQRMTVAAIGVAAAYNGVTALVMALIALGIFRLRAWARQVAIWYLLVIFFRNLAIVRLRARAV